MLTLDDIVKLINIELRILLTSTCNTIVVILPCLEPVDETAPEPITLTYDLSLTPNVSRDYRVSQAVTIYQPT